MGGYPEMEDLQWENLMKMDDLVGLQWENPIKMDDNQGTPISGNLQMEVGSSKDGVFAKCGRMVGWWGLLSCHEYTQLKICFLDI